MTTRPCSMLIALLLLSSTSAALAKTPVFTNMGIGSRAVLVGRQRVRVWNYNGGPIYSSRATGYGVRGPNFARPVLKAKIVSARAKTSLGQEAAKARAALKGSRNTSRGSTLTVASRRRQEARRRWNELALKRRRRYKGPR